MDIKQVSDVWIPYKKFNANPKIRLFCFPYAGGSASVFYNWLGSFPKEIDVCPIQYPGREARMSEPHFLLLPPLVEMLQKVLEPYLDCPFAFFGHSLGALVSFELARCLQKNGIIPMHLFVSGCKAPQIKKEKTPLHLLNDDEFIDKLRLLNGTPELVLQNSELMKLLLPTIRADFAVNYSYDYSQDELLSCPVSAFGGLSDSEVSLEALSLWKEQTINRFKLHTFQGDHFFIHQHVANITNLVSRELLSEHMAVKNMMRKVT